MEMWKKKLRDLCGMGAEASGAEDPERGRTTRQTAGGKTGLGTPGRGEERGASLARQLTTRENQGRCPYRSGF